MLKTALPFKLVVLFLLILGFTACNEDTIEPNGEGVLSGQVLDSDTNAPLSGISISTSPATTALITDANGMFIISDITAGDYTITAKKSGFKTESVTVAVKNGKETKATILLSESNEGDDVPGLPTEPSPENNASDISNSVTLQWKAPKASSKDTLTYDVYLYESGSNQKKKIAEAITDTSVVAENLLHGTTYFWQVTVRSDNGAESNGPIWSFSTASLPNARYLFARSVEGNYDIFSSDGTTANTFRLTSDFSREWWPLLNPKRDIIAYSSNAGIEPQIYTMNRDGSAKKQITSVPIAGYHNPGIGFAWAPDGGQLIYGHYALLYRINRDGSGLTVIANAPANRHFRMLDWTATGNKILAQTIGASINDSEIYIMEANGTNMTLLVENLPGRVESPAFSIDGKSILYTRDVSGFENTEGRQLDSRIFRKNIDGTGLMDMSASKPAGTNDLYPRYSPTGDKIIFVNTPNDGFGPYDVYVMDAADGKNRTKIFSNAIMPDWK
ncbi:carboxypeptidase-like regulatory domain-containing protein [Pontibacter oryzae]|uniref:Fibronectin type-III domain-containing protein n=1 Tax=Pontibacter oryzae TaxID=2304593 RepID=A0A399RQ87_9BACT|nr:carboxypeptidase-like regulatory domain-containing protein [Pontibacter oryzae]RIJ33970.1 hypothetical protein D1627_16460 [Pontibacter oryzae]